VKSPTSSISIIIKSVVVVTVMVKKSILLLSNTKLRSIAIGFPTRESTIKFRIFPIDRKDCFTFKLLAKDGKVTWCVNMADMTVILRAILVTMPGVATVVTDKVVVRVGGYDGDAGRCGGCWGHRMLVIMCGKVRRGRSRCMCNACSTGGSGGTSAL
jgi:hypothetical protein